MAGHSWTMGNEELPTAAPDAARVYVGNLKPKANEAHLAEAFARFGTILNIWVARKPPGFAFVFFERERDAHRAAETFGDEHPLEILGKRVKVELAGDKGPKRASSTRARDDADEREERTASPRQRNSQRLSGGHARRPGRRRSRSPSSDRSHTRRYRRERSPGRKRRRSPSSSSRSASPRRRDLRYDQKPGGRRRRDSSSSRGGSAPLRRRSRSRSRSTSRSTRR